MEYLLLAIMSLAVITLSVENRRAAKLIVKEESLIDEQAIFIRELREKLRILASDL